MRTAIDRAGRIVIPKALRDDLGLEAGQALDISVRDGRIEIEPATIPMRLVRRGGHLTAVPDEELPALTPELVRATLESVRR